MKKYFKFISFVIVSMFCFFITYDSVFATTNLESFFEYTIPVENVDSEFNSDYSFKEFTDLLVSQESNYYYYQIRYYYGNMNNAVIYLIPKNISSYKYNFYGYSVRNDNNTAVQFYFYGESIPVRKYEFSGGGLTISDSQIQEFKNCFLNNNCSSSSFNSSSVVYTPSVNISSQQLFATTYRINITDSSSVNFDDYDLTYNQYIYRTDYPMTYDNTYVYSTNYRYYHKSVIVNGKQLENGDNFPSYYDVYLNNETEQNYIKKSNYLEDIYVGSIPKSNISNFKINLDYTYFDDNFVNSIEYKFLFFGRKNNDNKYYSYESINCSATNYVSSAIDTDVKHVTTTIFPSGFTCSSDLTNYDNIYIKIYYLYDTYSNRLVNSVNFSSNYGNITMLENTISSHYGSMIYEKFDNLPYDFSILLSTISDSSRAYILSDSDYLGISSVERGTTKISNLLYYNEFGNVNNTNLMIFNLQNYNSNNTNLELFIDNDTIVSFGSNNLYFYYDENGTITSDTIINSNALIKNTSYDLKYYFGIVNDYISSINGDIYDFSVLIQNTYDLMPQLLQTIVFVFFILGCVYILFKLIKR